MLLAASDKRQQQLALREKVIGFLSALLPGVDSNVVQVLDNVTGMQEQSVAVDSAFF